MTDIKLIIIPENEIQMDFVRSSGPGGQNVNKVSTAVHLRFDVGNSSTIPEHAKKRLMHIAGKRIDSEGILHIQASTYRTQNMNREDALKRLNDFVQKAMIVPRKRIKTKPTAASKEKKLQDKKMNGQIKTLRKPVRQIDD